MQNPDLLITLIIATAIIILLLLLVIMYKSFQSLKDATHDSTKSGAIWINQKMYDFDGEQLGILIKKIKKVNKNDQPI